MKLTLNAAALLAAMTLSAGPALSKAHDMGKADGSRGVNGLTTSEFIKSLDGAGVSAVVNNGRRGTEASRLKGDNRTIPTHKNPDAPAAN